MLILLAGAAGQLGCELTPILRSLGEVRGADRIAPQDNPGMISADLGDLAATERLVDDLRPDVIVNAAAYTAVDRAESDREAAFRVNSELPACLARWAKLNDRLLVHYSTDYVFSGASGRPFIEADKTGPLNAYGESKLAGELEVASSGCLNLVLRSSWVYSSIGHNFVLTMLDLASKRPELSIVNDQVGCPTWARNLARTTARAIPLLMQDRSKGGLYHYCDSGIVSWFEFAAMIFTEAEKLGLIDQIPNCSPVDSSAFQQAATRPGYSALDTSRIRQVLGIEPASLEQSLRACLADLQREDGK